MLVNQLLPFRFCYFASTNWKKELVYEWNDYQQEITRVTYFRVIGTLQIVQLSLSSMADNLFYFNVPATIA